MAMTAVGCGAARKEAWGGGLSVVVLQDDVRRCSARFTTQRRQRSAT